MSRSKLVDDLKDQLNKAWMETEPVTPQPRVSEAGNGGPFQDRILLAMYIYICIYIIVYFLLGTGTNSYLHIKCYFHLRDQTW